jgi:hypothetical protein
MVVGKDVRILLMRSRLLLLSTRVSTVLELVIGGTALLVFSGYQGLLFWGMSSGSNEAVFALYNGSRR